MINEDIEAMKLSLDKRIEHNCNYSIFTFTNENLREYLPKFDLDGKDILTVTASGDHYLNMALLGAKSITTFDVSKLAYYWTELKRAGVITLSLPEFRAAFIHGEINSKYKTIRTALTPNTLNFWDAVADSIPMYVPSPNPFVRRDYYEKVHQEINPYLDDDKYPLLQKKLDKINIDFINCDIFKLPQKTKNKFDGIFTSNISEWHKKEQYDNFAFNALPKLLRQNGFAQTHYYGLAQARNDTATDDIPVGKNLTNIYFKDPWGIFDDKHTITVLKTDPMPSTAPIDGQVRPSISQE